MKTIGKTARDRDFWPPVYRLDGSPRSRDFSSQRVVSPALIVPETRDTITESVVLLYV